MSFQMDSLTISWLEHLSLRQRKRGEGGWCGNMHAHPQCVVQRAAEYPNNFFLLYATIISWFYLISRYWLKLFFVDTPCTSTAALGDQAGHWNFTFSWCLSSNHIGALSAMTMAIFYFLRFIKTKKFSIILVSGE